MTDRELLELAAKAAGIGLLRCRLNDPMWKDFLLVETRHGQGVGWNPLNDDGDALRLAVKLGLQCDFGNSMVTHPVEVGGDGTDSNVASRQAIVRAAAAIGKEMP